MSDLKRGLWETPTGESLNRVCLCVGRDVEGGGGGVGLMGGRRPGCLVVRFRPSDRPRGHQTHTHINTQRDDTEDTPTMTCLHPAAH